MPLEEDKAQQQRTVKKILGESSYKNSRLCLEMLAFGTAFLKVNDIFRCTVLSEKLGSKNFLRRSVLCIGRHLSQLFPHQIRVALA